jgi:hypothetical protein
MKGYNQLPHHHLLRGIRPRKPLVVLDKLAEKRVSELVLVVVTLSRVERDLARASPDGLFSCARVLGGCESDGWMRVGKKRDVPLHWMSGA